MGEICLVKSGLDHRQSMHALGGLHHPGGAWQLLRGFKLFLVLLDGGPTSGHVAIEGGLGTAGQATTILSWSKKEFFYMLVSLVDINLRQLFLIVYWDLRV